MEKAQVEINKFVGGLVTDASPLTFPENTSSTDINMELNIDGSRKRAFGMDYEAGATEVATTVTSAGSLDIGINSFRWENVGGDPLKIIICIQIGNQVKFFNADSTPLSLGLIDTKDFPLSSLGQKFSFASIDSSLVIATGQENITTVTYDSGVLSYTTSRIKVRDFFGVEDKFVDYDLTVGSGLEYRPITISEGHLYNLRNQGFAIPRIAGNNEFLEDPISTFRSNHTAFKGVDAFPSNSDEVGPFLYTDSADTDDRNSKRYFAVDSVKNPLGSSRAGQGYFIIDILARGTSRLLEADTNRSNYSSTPMLELLSLPADTTPGGATVLGEYAGRVWYGGFNGEVTDGDTKSPRLSSYIAFSQLVTDPTVITQCYQAGDPTSDIEPDIIDTDGGYIRLNNAYGITSFNTLGKSLFISAANGVWRIFGGNDSGFSATNYVIEKVTDKGVRGVNSLVEVDNTLLYWSDDGIYWMKQNQFGDWGAENITQGRIQSLYNKISIENKVSVSGVYDGYQRKVRWLYGNRLYDIEPQKELVLNINLSAFYERHIGQIYTNSPPVLVSTFNTNVFKLESTTTEIVADSVQVVVGADNVELTSELRVGIDSLFEVGYVAVTQITPVVKYVFCSATNSTWTDWESFDSVGIDAPATLVTGASHGGETMRYKQIPYLNVFLRRTEDGMNLVNGVITPANQSSCHVQSLWDWTNSANSNKWGTPFQAYRYKRGYLPENVNDAFDTGYELIATKNKLRGRGRAVALKFTSTPKKEMHIYGWSLNITVPDD